MTVQCSGRPSSFRTVMAASRNSTSGPGDDGPGEELERAGVEHGERQRRRAEDDLPHALRRERGDRVEHLLRCAGQSAYGELLERLAVQAAARRPLLEGPVP